MERKFDRKIVLEDGSEYKGYGFGAYTDRVCELVFNTSMSGYQEIVSDPSYTYQMVVMSYALIGNYGITDEDYESRAHMVGGLVVRDYNDMPSNFRYTKTLSELMAENGVPGIYGVDTRKLTRALRDFGTQKVLITDVDTPLEEALKIIKETEIPKDSVKKVSCKKKWYSRTSNHKYNIVAIDCGIRLSTIESLNKRGCNVTIVPYDTKASEIRFMNPDGLLLSDGPGNPEDIPEVVKTLKEIKGEIPVFGIGLGHQVVALSYGAKITEMKKGHRGVNHPIKCVETGRVDTAIQNHGYVVDEKSLSKTGLKVTFVNTLDNTVEGIENAKDRVFSVQFQPGSICGSKVNENMFDKFIRIIKEGSLNA